MEMKSIKEEQDPKNKNNKNSPEALSGVKKEILLIILTMFFGKSLFLRVLLCL